MALAVPRNACLPSVLLLALALGFGRPVSASETFPQALSFQGYTGILNTPNAEVAKEKTAYLLWTDQIESQFDRRMVSRQDNYFVTLGLLPWVEFGGRFSNADGPRRNSPFGPTSWVVRDLSANLKVQLPLPDKPFVPKVAAGMSDISGGAQFFQAKYAVVSEELGPVRLSVGYGRGPQRMEGLFGGIEARVFSWLYLRGEHSEEEEVAYGVRLVSPPLWRWPVSLHATAKSSTEDRKFYWSFGLQVPLGLDDRERGSRAGATAEPRVASRESKPSGSQVTSRPSPTGEAPRPTRAPSGQDDGRISELRRLLVAHGFQNIRAGIQERVLLVEYDNAVYNWNELDALGIVLFKAAETAPDGVDLITAVIKKRNLRIMTVTAPRDLLSRFREDPTVAGELRSALEATYGGPDAESPVPGPVENSSFLTSSVVLAPGLTTTLGNEFSAFEYLLSLKPELQTNLWKGAITSLRWDVPLLWSHEFEENGFLANSRKPTKLDRVMLFQGVRLLPSVTATLGGGMVLKDQFGTLNEVAAHSPEGDHRVRLKHIQLRNRETEKTKKSYVASYRYRYQPLDLSLEANVGQFFSEDKGLLLELKRFFGDTSISLYYKDTRLKEGSPRRWKAAGIQIGIPLTPRRDMKPRIIQVRGTDEFNYAQETTLVTKDMSLNFLAPVPLAINFQPTINTERIFYGRDRITPSYLKEHLLRLRDAYLTYGGREKVE
ncbi:MAG: YjbH domain-containing protein [Deltaproteobacteria bacterium]|nr:YjbH domain-containing protein [Deltaproteobacteria bacterium]